MTAKKQPTIYIPHGGGPCFFMDGMGPPGTWDGMAAQPDLLYDYYGFPPHTYELTYPAQGSPAVAEEIVKLLQENHIDCGTDSKRGLDHGVFIPFMDILRRI